MTNILNASCFTSYQSTDCSNCGLNQQSSWKTRFTKYFVTDNFIVNLSVSLNGPLLKNVYISKNFNYWIKITNINKEPSLLNIIVFTSYFKEDFSKVRVMSYINSDVFLVCFSIDDVKSLVHVQESWVPELRQHVPNTPFILVGTKLDVRFQQPDIQVGNRK